MPSRARAPAERPERLRRPSRALLVVAALLFACRTAPGGADGGHFPMVEGMRWIYEVRTEAGAYELEVTARGEQPLAGFIAPVFVMDETTRGAPAGFVETAPVAYVVAEGYVGRITALDYGDTGELLRLGQDAPTRILPLPVQGGQRWSQETTLFRTPDGEGAFMSWSAEVRRVTSVRVPAGRFEAVEIESVYRDRAGEQVEPKAVYRDYYAPGVGLVKSVSESPSDDATVEQVLLEVHRPGP